MKKPAICIVSHNAYGALRGGGSGHIGGVERQTSFLAAWLAHHEYNTTILTWDEGGPATEWIDGIQVIKIAPRTAGLPGLRFFHPRWSGLLRALRQADADIYYHNCAECVTGQVALWCRRRRRPFVFYAANDPDCDSRLPEFKNPRDRFLYRYGLRHARVRIVQTHRQQAALKRGFGLDSSIIPMPCPEPESMAADGLRSRRVLWIGRICPQKRPDRLLDLAQACPDISFDLAGPAYPDAYSRQVCERARQLPNVTVHGPVSRERVPGLYANAACLCCTSDYEGFPNTFLEAWSHGLPMISTFDPDSLIVEKGMGLVAHDAAGLREALHALLGAPERYQQFSRNARNYFLESHRPEVVLPKFAEVFQSCVPS